MLQLLSLSYVLTCEKKFCQLGCFKGMYHSMETAPPEGSFQLGRLTYLKDDRVLEQVATSETSTLVFQYEF